MWSTLDSCSRSRRVVDNAEVTSGDANPRFVVTSPKAAEIGGQHLYEVIYQTQRRSPAFLRGSCTTITSAD
jgi:hypothetical protein